MKLIYVIDIHYGIIIIKMKFVTVTIPLQGHLKEHRYVSINEEKIILLIYVYKRRSVSIILSISSSISGTNFRSRYN